LDVKIATSIASILLVTTSLIAADANPSRKAPELAFTVPGQGQKLLSQYRGKVVALEFIFTTCPHCQAASKVMSKFQREYGPQGFQAIDIAVNDNADLLVENFVKDYQVAFPVGWMSKDQMLSFMGFKDGRFVVPQMVLIDRKGNIRYQTPALENEDWDKLMKEDAIKQHIEELLGSSSSAKRAAPAGNGRIALAKKST
jgi:thiol-disulfide isomerase/thioredoxin